MDLIINDQLDLASLPAGSVMMESQVNLTTEHWFGVRFNWNQDLYWNSAFWPQQTLESTKTVPGSMLNIRVLVVAVIRLDY